MVLVTLVELMLDMVYQILMIRYDYIKLINTQNLDNLRCLTVVTEEEDTLAMEVLAIVGIQVINATQGIEEEGPITGGVITNGIW